MGNYVPDEIINPGKNMEKQKIFSKITIVSDNNTIKGLDRSIINDQDIIWTRAEDNIDTLTTDGVLLLTRHFNEREETIKSLEQKYGRPMFLIDMATFFECYYSVLPNSFDDRNMSKYMYLHGEKTQKFKSFVAVCLKIWGENYSIANLLIKIPNTTGTYIDFSDVNYVMNAIKHIKNKSLHDFVNMEIDKHINDISFSAMYLP